MQYRTVARLESSGSSSWAPALAAGWPRSAGSAGSSWQRGAGAGRARARMKMVENGSKNGPRIQ